MIDFEGEENSMKLLFGSEFDRDVHGRPIETALHSKGYTLSPQKHELIFECFAVIDSRTSQSADPLDVLQTISEAEGQEHVLEVIDQIRAYLPPQPSEALNNSDAAYNNHGNGLGSSG